MNHSFGSGTRTQGEVSIYCLFPMNPPAAPSSILSLLLLSLCSLLTFSPAAFPPRFSLDSAFMGQTDAILVSIALKISLYRQNTSFHNKVLVLKGILAVGVN